MLEGNEVEGKIGKYGGYFVDIKDNGDVIVSLNAKLNIVVEIKNFAVKKDIKWLVNVADFIGNMLPKALAKKAPVPPAV